METIKSTTKRALYYVRAYSYAEDKDVNTFYKKPSARKKAIFRDIFDRYQLHGNPTVKVWGNGFVFTVGWKTEDGLRIESAYGSYMIPKE